MYMLLNVHLHICIFPSIQRIHIIHLIYIHIYNILPATILLESVFIHIFFYQ